MMKNNFLGKLDEEIKAVSAITHWMLRELIMPIPVWFLWLLDFPLSQQNSAKSKEAQIFWANSWLFLQFFYCWKKIIHKGRK